MFVERFMAWAVAQPSSVRAEGIADLTAAYRTDQVADQDIEATEQVFTLFLDDPDIVVRRALSAGLATSDRAPRALIWSLMNDIFTVAEPIFARSTRLTSAELTNAATSGSSAIATLIAGRSLLDGQVVRAIAKDGCADAVEALLHNRTIILGSGLLDEVAQRFADDGAIRNALLDQPQISAISRHRLAAAAAADMAKLTIGNATRIAAVASDALDKATVEIATQCDVADLSIYAAHLSEQNVITPSLLVRSICVGNAALFETMFATATLTNLSRVQSIMDDSRRSAFRALCKKANLPVASLPLFEAALSNWTLCDDPMDMVEALLAAVEGEELVDGALVGLLGRIASELHRNQSRRPDQLLLAAA
ncbi:conserved hypothetical protein [Ahrensia sp. R2A130]|nr:conserved hypothetical protein [Ahrensia sp. R2A130]